jgi:hypothetical protein
MSTTDTTTPAPALAAARAALGALALQSCDFCTAACPGCLTSQAEAVAHYHHAMAQHHRRCGAENEANNHDRHATLVEEAGRDG